MARRDLVRHQHFLPGAPRERLEEPASKPGAAKSWNLAAPSTAVLDRRAGSEREEGLGLRPDRLSAQRARIERDGQVQLESLALSLRFMLRVDAPLPDEECTWRSIGRDRFGSFVARLGQQLAGGRRAFVPEAGR